jgi:hypothetical protein
VKHQAKMPAMIMSAMLLRPRAITRQPSTTVRGNASLFGQALCSESVLSRSGYLAASHLAVAALSDRRAT